MPYIVWPELSSGQLALSTVTCCQSQTLSMNTLVFTSTWSLRDSLGSLGARRICRTSFRPIRRDVGVDWHLDVAVDRSPHPHLERQLFTAYRLPLHRLSSPLCTAYRLSLHHLSSPICTAYHIQFAPPIVFLCTSYRLHFAPPIVSQKFLHPSL